MAVCYPPGIPRSPPNGGDAARYPRADCTHPHAVIPPHQQHPSPPPPFRPSFAQYALAALLFALLWSPGLAVALGSGSLDLRERLAVLGLSFWLLAMGPALLGSFRTTFLLWTPVVLLLPPYVYLCLSFGSTPGDALVAAAMHTSPARSLEVVLGFGGWLWVWAALIVAYALAGWHIDSRWRWDISRRKQWLAALLGAASLSLVLRQALPQHLSLPPFFERSTVDQVFPLNLWSSVQRVTEQDRRAPQTTSLQGRPRPGSAAEPLHLVLVIGETVRPDHLGVYGYARDTTPGLSAIRDELLLFHDVASTAHWTDAAVPGIVARTVAKHRRAGLVRTMREGGYHTAWLSNQEGSALVSDAHVADFARGSYDFLLRLDTALLPPFDALLRQAGPRQLIALHMIGSHFPYEERYDAQARKFFPTLADAGVSGHPGARFKAQTINSYDNTLVALDRFLTRVIAALRADREPALLVFTSDHGENLFDDDRQRFMHALADPSKADTTVPLFFWANDAYRRRWPAALPALAARSRAPVSHADLMPTLLDLAGIDADGIAPQESLVSTDWRPRPRHLQQIDGPGWDYDKIR
jgi:glucan phosphoethanolaminetransferase (alkaline phosphatase superfamily)